MQFVERLIRWSQYRWDNQVDYVEDIITLRDTFAHRCVPAGYPKTVFRGQADDVELKFADGTTLPEADRMHECWTTDKRTAMRFALNTGGHLYFRDIRASDVLFDMGALTALLPPDIVKAYYDLQDTEGEVVLVPGALAHPYTKKTDIGDGE